MRVKLTPRLKPNLGWKEIIRACLPSKGKIKEYEQKFAEKFDCNYGIMFSHGRTGLYSLLKVWNLKNDEVLCPAYTCVVVPHAIVLSGNIPVFIDCAQDSYNMDYELMEAAISQKTRVIIPTHLWGYPMDVFKIKNMVERAERKYGHKIYVIHDTAHSYGAKWQDKLVTGFGDAAIFGSNISKVITSVFGGMVTTNDEETFRKLVSYRHDNFKRDYLKSTKRFIYLLAVYIAFNPYVYSIVNRMERKGFLNYFTKYFDEGKIEFPAGWNTTPCELEARVGLVQLNKYDSIIAQRIKNAETIIKHFALNKDIQFPKAVNGCTYSHCVASVNNRDQWVDNWRIKGVQLGILIEYCVPEMKAYLEYAKMEYPIASYHSKHTINFPIWGEINLN